MKNRNIKEFINLLAIQFDSAVAMEDSTQFRKLNEWDSMTALLTISMIYDEYGVSISGDELQNFHTIKSLFEYIMEKAK